MLKTVLQKCAVIVATTGLLSAGLTGTANAAPPTCTTPFGQKVPANICHQFTFDTRSHAFDRSDAVALCVLTGLAFPPSTLFTLAFAGYQCVDSIIDPGPKTQGDAAGDCVQAFVFGATEKGGINAKMVLENGVTCTLNFQNTKDSPRGDFVTIYA